MEKNKITLKKKIGTFLANSLNSTGYSQFKIDSVVYFHLTEYHNIKIENNIIFSFHSLFGTKIFALSKGYFISYGKDIEILNELEIKFSLIKKVGLNKDLYSLHFREPSDDFNNCYIAFQRNINQFFLMIYSSKRFREAQCLAEDYYGDDIFYIHCIWEVELSEDFKKKVFGESV